MKALPKKVAQDDSDSDGGLEFVGDDNGGPKKGFSMKDMLLNRKVSFSERFGDAKKSSAVVPQVATDLGKRRKMMI